MTGPASVCIVGNGQKDGVRHAAERLLDLLEGRVDVTGVDLEETDGFDPAGAEMVIVLGGDGALLRASREFGDHSLLLFGINFGKLGFLAGVRAAELEQAVEDVIIRGRYRLSTRMKLDASVKHPGGRVEGPFRALNDAVVERWDARSLEIRMLVDDEPATVYRGDGVIVATPTGSTAHSLAAGGPIVEPGMAALVVSPLCSHGLATRPLVLDAERVLRLDVGTGSRRPGLAVDGQVLVDLEEGAEVTVSRSEQAAKLVMPTTRSHFVVLRTRLRWAGRPPYEAT